MQLSIPVIRAMPGLMLPVAILLHVGSSPGQTFGISLFNAPIRESLNLSHSTLTGSYLIASLLAAFPLMFIGRQMDRLGLKRVTLVLAISVGLACLFIANVSSLLGLTAAFFLLRTFGQGGLSLAAGNTLGTWFHQRLGFASGIAGVGMSLAVAVTPLLYLHLINTFEWQKAYMIIGVGTWCVLLPVTGLIYRNSPLVALDPKSTTEMGNPNTDFELRAALSTPAYWTGLACTALNGMICTAVLFNLVPLFQQLGFTAAQAAAIFPTLAIAMATMQLNGGLLADWLPLSWLMAVSMAGLAAGTLALGYAQSVIVAHIGAALLGGGQGLMAVTGNTLWPRYFGRLHLGSIRSSVWTATVAACSVGPFLMGFTLDQTGGYGVSLWIMAGLAGTASIASLITARPPIKVSHCVDAIPTTPIRTS